MPENEDEIILRVTSDHFYIKERLDEVLNKTFSILKSQGRNSWNSEKS